MPLRENSFLWDEMLKTDVFLSLSLFPPPIKHQVQRANGQTLCGELLLPHLVLPSFFPALMDVGLWEQGFPFGLCFWAEFFLNHLGCGWAAYPWYPAVQEAAGGFSCTELGITKFVRASGQAGMDAALSNWLHLEWLRASQGFTDAFFEGV